MPRRRETGNRRIEIRDRRLDGGRLVISAGTANRKEAEAREHSVRQLLDRGELEIVRELRARRLHIAELHAAVKAGDLDRIRRRNAESLTLAAVCEAFMARAEATLEEGTLRNYRTLVRQLSGSFGGGRELGAISTGDAETWLHASRKRGKQSSARPWSPGRQELQRVMAGAIWDFAIARERELALRTGARPRIRDNPWKAAETPRVRVTRVAFLQVEEWRTLYRRTWEGEDAWLACLLALGCLSGLRLAEALHLRPGLDVDLDKGVLHVQPREGEFAWRPKTDRSVRDVPIGDELRSAIQDHIDAGFAGDRYLIRLPGKDEPVRQPTIQRYTKRAFEAAGLRYGREGDGLTFHSLRHTFASWLVQRDVQLMKVAQLMGDTTLEVERTYAHLLPQDLEKTVRVLDAIVREAA